MRPRAGADYSWSGAEDETRRSRGPRANVTANLALPFGFTFGARASMQWTEYYHRRSAGRFFTIDREPREDQFRIFSGSVFNRAFTQTS